MILIIKGIVRLFTLGLFLISYRAVRSKVLIYFIAMIAASI